MERFFSDIQKTNFRNTAVWSRLCYLLAYHNRLDLLKTMDAIAFNAIYGAAEGGHFDLLKSLLNSTWLGYKVKQISTICECAAWGGHFEIVKWLIDNKYKPGNFMKYAVGAENLDILKWGLSKGYEIHPITCEQAALKGNTELLQFAVDNGLEITKDALDIAAKENNWKFIRFALKLGNVVPHRKLIHWAAYHGNQEIVEWLLSLGCQWNQKTFSLAAQNRNLTFLKWMRLYGCPWMPLLVQKPLVVLRY